MNCSIINSIIYIIKSMMLLLALIISLILHQNYFIYCNIKSCEKII